VAAAEREAKFWLTPIVQSWNAGFRSGELKEIESLIVANLQLLLEAWHGFFNAG